MKVGMKQAEDEVFGYLVYFSPVKGTSFNKKEPE